MAKRVRDDNQEEPRCPCSSSSSSSLSVPPPDRWNSVYISRDLLGLIFMRLDIRGIFRVRRVCKKWQLASVEILLPSRMARPDMRVHTERLFMEICHENLRDSFPPSPCAYDVYARRIDMSMAAVMCITSYTCGCGSDMRATVDASAPGLKRPCTGKHGAPYYHASHFFDAADALVAIEQGRRPNRRLPEAVCPNLVCNFQSAFARMTGLCTCRLKPGKCASQRHLRDVLTPV